jgi:hypothetical protein
MHRHMIMRQLRCRWAQMHKKGLSVPGRSALTPLRHPVRGWRQIFPLLNATTWSRRHIQSCTSRAALSVRNETSSHAYIYVSLCTGATRPVGAGATFD